MSKAATATCGSQCYLEDTTAFALSFRSGAACCSDVIITRDDKLRPGARATQVTCYCMDTATGRHSYLMIICWVKTATPQKFAGTL
jgi:hypothetical protein